MRARGRMRARTLWAVAFLGVLLPCQLAVGMRASATATVTGDEPFYLLTAQSLVSDRDLDLRDEYADRSEMARFWDGTKPLWKQMEPTPDGRLLSPHNPGLSLLIAPAYNLGGLDGVRRLLVVVWAVAMAFAVLLARRAAAPDWAALLAAIACGVGAPGLVYASQVYPEGPAALCIAMGLLLATAPTSFGWHFRPPEVPPKRWLDDHKCHLNAAGLAATLVGLMWLGVKYLPYAALIAGIWTWRNRRERAATALAGGLGAIAALHFVWWHLHTFDSLTPYSTNVVWSGEGTATILTDHLNMPGRTYRLYGLFLDARFGLFRWLPIAVLAAWGFARRTALFATTVAIAIALGTFVSITMMGYWFPGRMLIAACPALVVLVATGAARVPRAATALAVWGLAIAAAVAIAAHPGAIRLAVDPWKVGFPLAPAWLFPDFRHFGLREVGASAVWIGALALGAAGRPWLRAGDWLSEARRRLHQDVEVPLPRR